MSVIDVAVFFFLHAYIVPLPMFYMYMYHVTRENKAVFHLIYRYNVLRESWRSLENMRKTKEQNGQCIRASTSLLFIAYIVRKTKDRMASVFAHRYLCCSLPT